VHAPAPHAIPVALTTVVLQLVVHAPQWLASVLRLSSHPFALLPSQSPNPELQLA
jgi:hypothetical protein